MPNAIRGWFPLILQVLCPSTMLIGCDMEYRENELKEKYNWKHIDMLQKAQYYNKTQILLMIETNKHYKLQSNTN